MPGEPAETMIGVAGVGLGALLLYAAVKNKSPIAIIRNAVTTGSLDLSNVPNLVGSSVTATWQMPPAVDIALTVIAVKDPALAAQIKAELATFDSNTPYDKTKHFFDLMSQARAEGFDSEAQTIENYVNNLVKPASLNTSGGGGTITV